MFLFLQFFSFTLFIYIASDILLLVIIVHRGKAGLSERKLTDVRKKII